MAFFGKSESELKQVATELENRKLDLDNRESDIKNGEVTLAHERTLLADEQQRLKDERSSHAAQVKSDAESTAADRAILEKRRTEIAFLEAKAKADFADLQREAFEEVVEKRQTSLDSLQEQLNAKATDLAKRLIDFHEQEADLARRTLVVTEREQKADSGFADKAKSLAEEAARQHQANKAEADRLGRLRDTLAADRHTLEEEKAALTERVQAVQTAEHKRDNGYAEERSALEALLHQTRIGLEVELTAARQKRLSEIEAELTQLKASRLGEVSKAEQTERDRVRAEITKERQDWTKQQEDDRHALQEEKQEIEKLRGQSFAQHNDLERRKAALEKAEQVQAIRGERLEAMWQKRNDELEDEIETRVTDRRQSLERVEADLRNEISRLRDSLQIQASLAGAFEQLKRQLGNRDPAEVIRELNSKTDDLKRLQEELATRPTEEMRESYQQIERVARNHKARADQLMMQLAENEAAVAEVADLRRSNSELDADNKSLTQRAKRFEDASNAAQSELDRLRKAYERPAEIEDRHR